jgi:hypothetical protein
MAEMQSAPGFYLNEMNDCVFCGHNVELASTMPPVLVKRFISTFPEVTKCQRLALFSGMLVFGDFDRLITY